MHWNDDYKKFHILLGGRVRSGGEGGGEDSMMAEPGVIQVTPQDKEAIERVRKSIIDQFYCKIQFITTSIFLFFFSAKSSWIRRTFSGPGLLCLWKERKPCSKFPPITKFRWLRKKLPFFKNEHIKNKKILRRKF